MDQWPEESLHTPYPDPYDDAPQPTSTSLPRFPTEEELEDNATPRPQAVWNGALDRVPSDYLLEAKGDVRTAAVSAGVDRAQFIRALAADTSLPRVAKSIHFMALLGSLELMQLAQEALIRTMTGVEPPEPGEPLPPDMKSLLAVFKVSSDFIALSNMHQNPTGKGTNRHQPPTKGAILEATRGLPTTPAGQSYQQAYDQGRAPTTPPGPDEDTDERITALRAKLAAAPPEVQMLVADALQVAADAQQQDGPSDPDDDDGW